MEYPAFIKNDDGKQLYSVLHLPSPARGCGFVFCAPLFGEKTKSYRVAVAFARELAARGHPVLRFDYAGDGDSEGGFEEAAIESRLRDIGSAVRHLQAAAKDCRVVLAGLRLGATLAALAARRIEGVRGLLLWAPVFRVRDYLFEYLRANLSAQLMEHRRVLFDREQLVEKMQAGETVNVDGWEMNPQLWEEGKDIDLAAVLAELSMPALLATIGDAGDAPVPAGVNSGNVRWARLPQEFSWMEWNVYNPRPGRLFAASLAWVGECFDDNRRDRNVQ